MPSPKPRARVRPETRVETRPSPPLDWEQIRLFLAVMREGSLMAAGARLGLDVSTVSRRLDRLEAQLGAALFDRSRDGTTPTAVAEQMTPHAEEMELSASRFAAAGAQVETAVEGTVRLTVVPGVADTFVAPRLAELHARHPKLVIELDASVSYADLTRREADLAIRATRPTSGELVTTKLVTTTALPLASPAYARALGRLRKLEDARWIGWSDALGHLPQARWLREHGPAVAPALRTDHFGSQLAAARAGLGVVLASAPFAHLPESGLVAIAHAKTLDDAWGALPTESLWLVGHRALRHVPRVAAVWDFVIESIGEEAARRLARASQLAAPAFGRATS
jgi:DNA-binding transcriptional LysR family regulator